MSLSLSLFLFLFLFLSLTLSLSLFLSLSRFLSQFLSSLCLCLSFPLFFSSFLSLSLTFTQIKALPPIRSRLEVTRRHELIPGGPIRAIKGVLTFRQLAVVRALAILANRATLTWEVHPCDILVAVTRYSAVRTFDSEICRLYSADVGSVTTIA